MSRPARGAGTTMRASGRAVMIGSALILGAATGQRPGKPFSCAVRAIPDSERGGPADSEVAAQCIQCRSVSNDITKHFHRDTLGRWTCMEPVTIELPTGRIEVAPGTRVV